MSKFQFEDEDIRQHLMMQQDIINRMASNSSNCKTWLITIIAALIALQISQDTIHNYGRLMIIVCVMFWYLDAFYLALERIHRSNEESFVAELKSQSGSVDKLIYTFSRRRVKNMFCFTLKTMVATSCLPFYVILIGLIAILAWGHCL